MTHAPCAFCGSPWCTCFDTDEEYEAMTDPKNPPAAIEPMIPFLTGVLLAAAHRPDLFKIRGVRAEPPDAFVIEFASGLALRVRVEQVPA